MDYLDTLRRNGWLADPTDKVRVVVIHRDSCPVNRTGRCVCQPRLVLAHPSIDEDQDLEPDVPVYDLASGE